MQRKFRYKGGAALAANGHGRGQLAIWLPSQRPNTKGPMANTQGEPQSFNESPDLSVLFDAIAFETERSTLAALFRALEGRAHAIALLLLVLPETVPLPLPSLSAILGMPLIMVSAHLLWFGQTKTVPDRIGRTVIPVRALKAALKYVGPALEWSERLAKPRWAFLGQNDRLVGAICLYLSLILVLPLPFFNLLPALCLAAVAFGAVHRDGLWIAFGIAATLCLTLALLIMSAELAAFVWGQK